MGDTSSNVQVNVGKIETEIEAIGNLNLGDQVAAALARIKEACEGITEELKSAATGEADATEEADKV
jgi:hypothetical protein